MTNKIDEQAKWVQIDRGFDVIQHCFSEGNHLAIEGLLESLVHFGGQEALDVLHSWNILHEPTEWGT